MFIVDLSYKKPLPEIEIFLEAHRNFLAEHYARGIFLASGPKNPRDGGVILVDGKITRSELDSILELDPFKKNGVADYRVIEFYPIKKHPALEGIQ